jgi:hypothetical protein
MFANTASGGMTMGFPDVCNIIVPLVGPVPIPFPNIAMISDASPTVSKIKYAGAAANNMKSKTSSSLGDQPGIAGGLVSGVFGMAVETILPVFTIILDSMPATRMLCLTLHNNKNGPGVHLAPCQTKVMYMRV